MTILDTKSLNISFDDSIAKNVDQIYANTLNAKEVNINDYGIMERHKYQKLTYQTIKIH